MVCMKCGSKTGVIDTIKQDDVIYRRRKCKACGHLQWTEEIDLLDDSIIPDIYKFKKEKYKGD